MALLSAILRWSLASPWALTAQADEEDEGQDRDDEEQEDPCHQCSKVWEECHHDVRVGAARSASFTTVDSASTAVAPSSVNTCSGCGVAPTSASMDDKAPAHGTAQQHARRRRRGGRGVLRWLRHVSLSTAGATMLAVGCLGRSRGMVVRTALVAVGVFAWKRGQRIQHEVAQDEAQEGQEGAATTLAHGSAAVAGLSGSGSSSVDLLMQSLAHSTPGTQQWLTADVAKRMLLQCGGELSKARDKVLSIHDWRQQSGLNCVRFPPRQAPAAAALPQLKAPHTRAHPHAPQQRQQQHQHQHQPAGGSKAQGSVKGAPSAAIASITSAVHRFPAVVPLIGCQLLHVDDARGLAVLWVEGTRLNGTKKALIGLLQAEAQQQQQQRLHARQLSPEAEWSHVVTTHVALMSAWVWSARLPDQPVAAGRYVQVVDLQDVPTSMFVCGDGLALIKAIMGAAHQFPQRLLATVIINPPRGLTVAWAVVSKLLPPPVQQKIRFIRSRQPEVIRAELLNFIPLALLPVELGGSWQRGPHAQRPAAQQELEASLAAATFVEV